MIYAFVKGLASGFPKTNRIKGRHMQNTANAAIAFFRDAGFTGPIARLVFHHIIARITNELTLVDKVFEPIGFGDQHRY